MDNQMKHGMEIAVIQEWIRASLPLLLNSQ